MMKLARFLKLVLIVVVSVFFGCAATLAPAADIGYFKGIRSTGTLWLQFGPAILNNCKRIDWYKGRPALKTAGTNDVEVKASDKGKEGKWVELDLSKVDKLSICDSDKNFQPLLNWVKNNFANKMNCSPENPMYRSVTAEKGALILYDDIDAKDDKWFCMPHLLTNLMSGKDMYGNVLMVIPLGPETFGFDTKEELFRLSQLEAILENKPQPELSQDPRIQELIQEHLEENKKKWFIDRNGKKVFNAGAADIMDWRFSEGFLTVQNLEGKTEFWNANGKLAFEDKFDSALRFKDGLCPACLNRKWGYIDHSGKFVIQPTFDEARYFCDGLAPVRLKDKWGYLSKSGEIAIAPKYEYCIDFSEGLAAASVDGKVGYIDKTGNFVIPPAYDQGCSFSAGVAGVIVLEGAQKSHHRWFIDKTGKKLFDYEEKLQQIGKKYEPVSGDIKPFNFREVSAGQKEPPEKGEPLNDYYSNRPSHLEYSEGLLPVWLGYHSAYLKPDGSIAIELDAENAEHFREGLAAVGMGHSPNKQWGFIDHSGKLVIDAKYDAVDEFSDGLAIVSNWKSTPGSGNKIIDKSGKLIGRCGETFIDAFSGGLCRTGSFLSIAEQLKLFKTMPGAPGPAQ